MISISFTDWGANTCEIYDKLLITKAVYNDFRVDWILISSVDLQMKPSILFALEAAASTWQFHFKSLHTKIKSKIMQIGWKIFKFKLPK